MSDQYPDRNSPEQAPPSWSGGPSGGPPIYGHEQPRYDDRYQPNTVPPVYHEEPGSRRHGPPAGAIIAIAAVVAFVVAAFAGLAGGLLGARLVVEDGLGGSAGAPRKITVVPSETDEPVEAASAAAVPSVVNIDVAVRTSSEGNDGLPDSHPNVPETSGNGSGVAFRTAEDGTYILTNNHVVERASRLTVRTSTGRSARAQLIGRDPETDIAVLLVKLKIPVIDTVDSSDLVVGQTVVAIGSPYGLEHSVTSGVVSAVGRSLPDFGGTADVYPLVDVIQTDAAINPGNSGGALVDRQGRLVGINTAIYSDSGASGGIGFAVPSNTAIRVADELIKSGSVKHPFLGVVGQTLTPRIAEEENIDVEEGALVSEVSKPSGAAEAGIRENDVITQVDGERVRSMDDLILQVRRKTVGDTVALTIIRDGKEMKVDVRVGDKPASVETPDGTDTETPQP